MYSLAYKLPSVETLKERFEIDPTSPSGLRWKVRRGPFVKPGDVAGCSTNTAGRWLIGGHDKLQASRIIWKMATGEDPKGVIDHIDGNPLNNRLENLQDISQRENLLKRVDFQK